MKHILEEEILRQLKLMRINKDNLLEQSSSQLTNQQKAFCQKLTSAELAGGVDMQTMSKNRKEHPECYKEKTVTNNKSTDLRSKTLYSNEAKYRYDLKNKNDEARLSRYKSGQFKNIYDLVYLDDLGGKNYSKEIKNLKYNVDSKSAFGLKYDIKEKDDAVKSGYNIYVKALNVRRKNAKSFGWTGPESYRPSNYLESIFPEFLQTSQLSTAIDPSYIEGVIWVEFKEQWFKLNYELSKLKQTIKNNYNSPYRKDGVTPFNSKDSNVEVDDAKIDETIKKNPEYNKLKNEMVQLQQQIDKVVLTINMINQWNTRLSFQKEDWKNNSCTIGKYYKLPKNQYIDLDLPESKNNLCQGQFIKYSMIDFCNRENQGGLWIVHDKMKWRRDFKGVDFKNLKIEFKDILRPDNLACGCAKGYEGRLTYDKLNVKSKVYQYCKIPMGNRGAKFEYRPTDKFGTFTVMAKDLEFEMVDSRKFIEKVTDWGQNCFTCSDSEGNTDCHCLLDIVSIATVFIPVVGPIISMLVDLANGGYYLVDALKADNNLDKNSAYLSAALTVLGGVLTGFGQARSLMLAKPNGKTIVSFGDKFISEVSSRGLKTEQELTKLSEELMATYKLTTKEAKLASAYVNGIKTLETAEAKAAIKKFTKTFKDLNSKLGFHNFQQLFDNKNFAELMLKNKGNITTALQEFAKKEMNKEFLTQIGFFVGGESILPGIIGPWAENKIKTGQWGNLKTQIESNGFDFYEVKKEFMTSGNVKDNNLLSAAWNDPKAIKVGGEMKPWRPGYPIPLKYQTEIYKRDLSQKQKIEKENKKYEEQTKDLDSSDSQNLTNHAYTQMDSL